MTREAALATCCRQPVVYGTAGYFPRPKGLITREMVSNLSALLMQLLVPCMLLSALGQNLDAATLGQSAGLVVWATVNLLISFVIAYFVLPRCVRVPQHLFVPFVLALTFNNSGSMPIVLLEPLARSPALAADPDAYDRALAYIWVYGLVWQVMLWGFGAPAAEEVGASLAAARLSASAHDKRRECEEGGPDALPASLPCDVGPAAQPPASALRDEEMAPAASRGVDCKACPAEAPRCAVPRDAAASPAPSGIVPGGAAAVDIGAAATAPSGAGLLHRRSASDAAAAPPSRATPTQQGTSRSAACAGRCARVAKQVLTSPPVLGIAGGSCLGLVRPAGDALFSPAGSLAPVGSVISTLGAAMVGSSNLVLAGSLYHGSVDTLARLRRRGKLPCAARPCQAQAPPPMQRAAASGELAPRSAPSQKEGGGSAAPGHSRSGVFGSGEPATPSRGSLSLEVPEPAGEEGLSATAMALVLAVRLVIAPAVSFGLYAAAMALKVPLLVPPGGSMASPEAAAAGTDPIIFVVALVQACTPSAQFALVITQQAGLSRAAESLSLLYLVMYPLSLLTMPAWITLALSLVFGNA